MNIILLHILATNVFLLLQLSWMAPKFIRSILMNIFDRYYWSYWCKHPEYSVFWNVPQCCVFQSGYRQKCNFIRGYLLTYAFACLIFWGSFEFCSRLSALFLWFHKRALSIFSSSGFRGSQLSASLACLTRFAILAKDLLLRRSFCTFAITA